jgi:starch synthase (maltosyl-transferring)
MAPPLIYNLFQRLVGPTTRWAEHARRAAEMEFNWLYLNPWHYPGFSGSLYAPKEFYRLNPLFLPPGAEEGSLRPLEHAVREVRDAGLRPMMDLIVNHTSKDSPLIDEHPSWYIRDDRGEVVSPSVREAHDPTQVTVWGDLAEIDNESSDDRAGLWEYWAEMVRHALSLGFVGFRCDAAYKVPPELWSHLIGEARRIEPGVEFFAETLGAPLDKVRDLQRAGFDYFFNSSKWWNFRETWALEQHEEFRHIAPSVSFPETHDTPRLAGETGGDERVQRQRYAFAAAFSAGTMMPVGYEFGFRKQVDVVSTAPSDWERRHFDLRGFVTAVNRLKLMNPVLHGEGVLRTPAGLGGDVLLLQRTSDAAPGEVAWIIVNTDAGRPRPVDLSGTPLERLPGHRLVRASRANGAVDAEASEDARARIELEPAEVVYLLPVGARSQGD